MNHEIIEHTKTWLNDIIVGLNFCPFARREMVNNRIHYEINDSKKLNKTLLSFAQELKRLDDDSIETTLFILPTGFSDFERYLDILDACQMLLEDKGLEGTYQLASMHPDYYFEGLEYDDPANFTNRSPYPLIHIIRESSMELALKNYNHPELIPENNMALAREKGSEVMKNMLESCFK
jgi:uncharacterized protein